MYAVFAVPREKMSDARRVLADDIISRQSIITREARALGLEGEIEYVLIEGSDEAIKRAIDMFSEINVKKAENEEDVYKKIKAEEESAADGMGLIFG
ncbi:MAG: hypothetical protein DRN20_04235 [Thermoplasmata archaeon]|nr:MAG: hypothetical protein DRN20_04235 [Thermoplasmata archaeon]